MSIRYSPWNDLAAREDITFGVTRLPSGQAWWLPDRRAIVMDDRLTRIERRCALAHELAHADMGDEDCARINSRVDSKQEKRADNTAALRLVELDDLIDALKWSSHLDEVATDLEVTRYYLDIRMHIARVHPAERAYLRRQLDPEGEV